MVGLAISRELVIYLSVSIFSIVLSIITTATLCKLVKPLLDDRRDKHE